jgi:vacuolar-type H+-ATPase subunit H
MSIPDPTSVKDILRQLLEAEEAGRRSAAALETEGEELIHEAKAECDAIVGQIRQETGGRVDELERSAQAQIEVERQAIIQKASEMIEGLRAQATARRSLAVDRVVALLLGELPS